MRSDRIKQREKSIIHKHSMEITINSINAHALNNSSMISSILDNFIYYRVQTEEVTCF